MGVDMCACYLDDEFKAIIEELRAIKRNHFLRLRKHDNLGFFFEF